MLSGVDIGVVLLILDDVQPINMKRCPIGPAFGQELHPLPPCSQEDVSSLMTSVNITWDHYEFLLNEFI